MNLNLNQTEMILYYQRIGSSWLIDGIYTFLAAPFGFMGFILNLVSLFIFYSINIKQTNLYIYLRFYSINGSLICLLSGLIFLSNCPRYSPYYLSYFWRFFRAYIYTMVYTTLYFIAILFDILIAFDRLAIFYKQIRGYIQFKPILMICLIVFFSILINLPICFGYYVKSEEEIMYEIKYNLSTFTLNGRTLFFYSQIADLIIYIQVFIRDILTLIIEITTSSIAFNLIRKFNTNHYEMRSISIEMMPNLSRNEIIRQKQIKDRQLLLMNWILNLTSIISHLLVISTFVYLSISRGDSIQLFEMISVFYFGVSFKHFTNFFIFYFFDNNFKKKCSEYIKILI